MDAHKGDSYLGHSNLVWYVLGFPLAFLVIAQTLHLVLLSALWPKYFPTEQALGIGGRPGPVTALATGFFLLAISSMVHFWCGRCLLLAYWGRGCLLAWILRTGSSLACRPRNLLILQWEAGSWLIWSRKFPWRAKPCRGWERSGLSSAFYVKTARSFRWVVEDSRWRHRLHQKWTHATDRRWQNDQLLQTWAIDIQRSTRKKHHEILQESTEWDDTSNP